MSCHHLMCLEEEEHGHLDDNSVDSNVGEPFLDLVGSGLGYIEAQIGQSFIDAAGVGHIYIRNVSKHC